MNEDEVKHQMDFILKQQAVFSSDMIELKNRMNRTSENLDKLASIVQRQAEEARIDRQEMRDAIHQQSEEAQINRQEMREAIENLIIGNEATRELANRAAQLAISVTNA